MNLVILAAGRATRMLPVHQNLYPKILVNLGNEVQIQKMLNSYEADTKTIVVDSFIAHLQVKEMLNALDIQDVNVVSFQYGAVGTLHTIRMLMHDKLIPTKNVILSWSDICPAEKLTIHALDDIIFTDNKPRHRMHFENGIVSAKSHGNLPGLYVIKDLEKTIPAEIQDFEDCKTTDIAELFQHNGTTASSWSLDFIDVGDVQKYEKYLENVKIEQRFFNDIEFSSSEVTKTANTEHGKTVIRSEIGFYLELAKHKEAETIFPKLLKYKEDSLTIKRLQNKTVNEYVKWLGHDSDVCDAYAHNMIANFTKAIRKLHVVSAPTEITIEDKANAMLNEYVDVTNQRYNKILNILPEITNVNGLSVNHSKVFEYIESTVKQMISKNPRFCLIHGDPNTSNAFMGSDMKFIDPRGQFGGIQYYGDPNYDYAKFAYGLTGYDNFNLTKDVRFSYDARTKEIQYDCIRGFDLDELIDDENVKFLVGLIWLKLPYYTINNINKAIVAYAHGLHLLTKSMNRQK